MVGHSGLSTTERASRWKPSDLLGQAHEGRTQPWIRAVARCGTWSVLGMPRRDETKRAGVTVRKDSSRWVEVTRSQFPHEAEGLAIVRDLLPDVAPFRAWTNFE